MLFGIAASLLLAVHADVHAPAPVAPAPVPQIGSQVDLPPMPGGSALLQGFGNPFRQYEGGSIPGWMYGGDATLFNDYLSLTPAAPHKTGWIWSTAPLNLTHGWEVEFDFHIGGAQVRGAGGGMAFWWTKEPGMAGQTYGHLNTFEGLGIFFDTYVNVEEDTHPKDGTTYEPYIAAFVNDGSELVSTHQPNFRRPTGLTTTNEVSKQVAVCFAPYRNLPQVARARIAWTVTSLDMWIDLDHTNPTSHWQSCLHSEMDSAKSSLISKLPREGYFGVSASTGTYGDAHVIYSLQPASLTGLNADDLTHESAHVAQPGEEPIAPEHQVHAESRDHHSTVPITETALPSATAESAEGSVALDSQEASVEHRPVHMPPEANHDERMDHLLRALEAQHELRAGLDQVLESIGMMSTERSSAQPSPQVLDLLGKVSRDIEALKHRAPAEGEAAGASGNEASKGVEALASEVGGIATKLAAIEEMLGNLHGEVVRNADKAHGELATLREHTMASVSTLKAEVTKLREDAETRHHNQVTDCRKEMSKLQTAVGELRSQSSSWVLFPLTVCAQALVLSAFLAYKSMGAGGAAKRSYLD